MSISADASQYSSFLPKQSIIPLNLPLNKIIGLYLEMPQVLTAYACRATLLEAQEENIVIERNNLGNYWVIQVQKQGYFLFPRPDNFKRLALLESLKQVFEFENYQPDNFVFSLKTPGELKVRKAKDKWQLEKKGQLVFGQAPLHFQWKEELRKIEEFKQEVDNLLKRYGEEILSFLALSRGWYQSLEKQYGEVITIVINTCMPMAYAIYKGPVLVPCQILLSNVPLILPGWDRGIDWEKSFYAKIHSKYNKDFFYTSEKHPLLPNQIYLKEIGGEANHTWALAKSYDEANTIVQKLRGNWRSLED